VDIRRKSEKPANIDLLKKMKLVPLPIGGQRKPKKVKSTYLATKRVKTVIQVGRRPHGIALIEE
jgi:hypothetical protein